MAENVQQSSQAIPQSLPIPRFIQSQLAHPPIGPNESAGEFRSLFHELAQAVQGGQRSAAEFVMLLQATILTFRIIGLERIRDAILQHMRPEAVVALIRLTDGVVERGSAASFQAYDSRKEYFASKAGQTKVEARFTRVGYATDAVDVEAFQLALPSLAPIDRQIIAAQKQLMTFLKEVDRRDAERAKELRRATLNAVSRARPEVADKREAN
ncbi:hypothetical protein [Bradyrhizobium arachidis]|uniref:hypothetical protein n=1 Tax=Bradyrhizobium arachidis TaxID=858423 RepID=UPI002163D64E|nr:hypothetical protein [Bradyrhizobium arachidis]UVO27596.1 hypothetical protein KUF59_34735 [Bradyrhizobium arachidis]